MNEEKKRNILKEARERLKLAKDEDDYNRSEALDDLEFLTVKNAQWPSAIRTEREANGQPCLTINKLPTFIDQVVGDQRMNRPSIKVLPVDNNADIRTAKVIGGWIKHVERISKSDSVIDHAFEHAVMCGYGAMRVITKYVSDDSVDEQEAYIQKIDNALAVYWGKHSEYDCSDANYCFIVTDVDRKEYKDTYGKEPMPFNYTDSRYVEGWCTKDTVRVVEYFVKEKYDKTIYKLSDGKTANKLEEGMQAVKTRKLKATKIMWYLLSGDDILESKEWPGKKYIPVIPVWGREVNVGGKRYIRSLIRNGKDPQRMYNYWQSCDTEVVALQPKSPYFATPKQIEGHEGQWNQLNKKSFPYVLCNPDDKAPGWPSRQAPPQASSAMVERINMADQEMRDTVGLQKASLGMQSNERSGSAIRERKKEGDVGTFSFIDNLSRSIAQVGRVLVDIAPVILDTERVIRIGLDNGEYGFDAVNVSTEDGKILNDLSVGTYDIAVVVGPSFTTQRTEAQQSMKEFIQYVPQAAPLIGDIYASTMDWARADEVSDRLEVLLPPEVKQKLDAAKKKRSIESGVVEDDTSAEEGTIPPPPNPLEILKIKEEELKLKEQELKVAQEGEKLKGLQLNNEMLVMTSKTNVKKMVDEMLKGGENAKGNEGREPVSET